jgi:hypothetical protein
MTVAVMRVVGCSTGLATTVEVMKVVVGAWTTVVLSAAAVDETATDEAAAVVVGVGTAAELEAAHRGAVPSTLDTIQEVASSV